MVRNGCPETWLCSTAGFRPRRTFPPLSMVGLACRAFIVFELIGRGFGVSRSTMPTMWHLCNVSRVWGSVARPGGG